MRRWLAVVLLSAGLPGCGAFRRPREPEPPAPVVAVPPPPVAIVPPAPAPIVLLLDAARRARAEGDLAGSARLLNEAIMLPDSDLADRAWVRLELGLLHADPASPLHNDDEAEFHLTRLATESPEAPAAAVGGVLLRLIDQARAAARDGAAAAASATELSEALAAARTTLARREQELERIKEILLGETVP